MRSQREDRQLSRTSVFLSWHSQRTGWEKSSFSSSSRSPKSGSSFLQQLTLSGFLQQNSLLCILSLPNPLGLWTKANSSECYCWITPCMFTICMAFSGWPCRGDCCPARDSFRVAGDEEWQTMQPGWAGQICLRDMKKEYDHRHLEKWELMETGHGGFKWAESIWQILWEADGKGAKREKRPMRQRT